MIEVKNLVKQYGDHIAVDHLSFTVEKGQIYGFLGPNGAGKSTTMNIMTGYLSATEGEVLINGHNIFEEPEEAKKCIGYLPEQPPLYMDMTPLEYLYFVAELKKIPKADRAQMIADIMKLVKITDVCERLIRNLSKGYKQRVGLAQAIMGYPEIIILDEPTVGLDPKQIIEIRDLIKTLSEKHTVILSSHILSEVSAVCDYVMIIAHGKLVASDTPDNLSKLMLGSNVLDLTIKGNKTMIHEMVSALPDIDSMEVHDSAEPGCVDIVVKSPQNVDVREELFYKFSEAKCPIMMMKSSNMSLEEVFLELTTDKASTKQEKKKTFFKKKEEENKKEENKEEKESSNESNI
ncbi:MAG: ABC transporter ATP-binding protein [Lachnospiraceae bacterium]|nr:ABC transporter ATP-binding protein [Lachnospiraceae bacterium]